MSFPKIKSSGGPKISQLGIGSIISPQIQQQTQLGTAAQKQDIGQQQQAPNDMVKKSYNDQYGNKSVNPQAGAQEQQAKQSIRSSESFNKALNVIKVAFPIMKGAYEQQAGQSGMIPGMVGGMAAKLGLANTNNIGSLHQAFNDVNANIAQQYSGNQGISKLFSAFSSGTPTETDSEDNAFAKLVTAGKTAYGIAKGVAKAGLTDEQLRTMNPDEVVKVLGDPNVYYTPEEGKAIEDAFAEEYKNTASTNIPNLRTGERTPNQPNALNSGLKGISDLFSGNKKQSQTSKNNDPAGLFS